MGKFAVFLKLLGNLGKRDLSRIDNWKCCSNLLVNWINWFVELRATTGKVFFHCSAAFCSTCRVDSTTFSSLDKQDINILKRNNWRWYPVENVANAVRIESNWIESTNWKRWITKQTSNILLSCGDYCRSQCSLHRAPKLFPNKRPKNISSKTLPLICCLNTHLLNFLLDPGIHLNDYFIITIDKDKCSAPTLC